VVPQTRQLLEFFDVDPKIVVAHEDKFLTHAVDLTGIVPCDFDLVFDLRRQCARLLLSHFFFFEIKK
jgi:hypothetical protein